MIAESHGRNSSISKETAKLSAKVAALFCVPPAVSESSYCSKSSLTFDAVSVLVSWVLAILIDVWWYLIYANFNLHFPGDIGCGTYFNIIICMSSLVRCLLISFAYF